MPCTERGVYRLPGKGPAGEIQLVAVNRNGERLLVVTAFPGVSVGSLERLLWRVLDDADPPLSLMG